MPRINKKTRIKGVPVKEQINFIDNKAGKLPVTPRIASDNRSGILPLASYDDEDTIVFGGGVGKGILESLVVYYNFNSASNDFEASKSEVTVETISENNHLIRPAYYRFYNSRSLNGVPLTLEDYTLSYIGNMPDDSLHPVNSFIPSVPSSSFFSTKNSGFGVPFEGIMEINDLNLTAVQFPVSQSRIISGSANAVFNLYNSPGGLSDSPWSVSFWLSMLPKTLPLSRSSEPAVGKPVYGYGKEQLGRDNRQSVFGSISTGPDGAIGEAIGGPFATPTSSSINGLKKGRTGLIFSVCRPNFSASIGSNFSETNLFGSLVRLEISEFVGLGPGASNIDGTPICSLRLYIGDTGDDNSAATDVSYLYAYTRDFTITDFYDFGENLDIFNDQLAAYASLKPKWSHVTITYDGSKNAAGISMYLNGKNLDKKSFREEGGGEYVFGGVARGNGGLGAAEGKKYEKISNIEDTIFTINGYGNIVDEVFNIYGAIDHFATFDKVLSENEIDFLSKKTLSPNPFNTKIDLFKQYIAGNIYKNGDKRGNFLPNANERGEFFTTLERKLDEKFIENNKREYSSNIFDSLFLPNKKIQTQNLDAFQDSGNPASDGKSKNENFFKQNADFEELNQPLWDKTKIEFELKNDFTYILSCVSRSVFPAGVFLAEEQVTYSRVAITGSNYMCFFDHENNAWRGNTFQFPFYRIGSFGERGHLSPFRGMGNQPGDSRYTSEEIQKIYDISFPDSWEKLINMYEEELKYPNDFAKIYSSMGIPQAARLGYDSLGLNLGTFTTQDFFEHFKIGFTDTWQSGLESVFVFPSWTPAISSSVHVPDIEQRRRYMGTPTDAFGFPFADKYKNILVPVMSRSGNHFVATEDKKYNNPGTALDVSGKITSPFLLEKVVVDFSASSDCPGVAWSSSAVDQDGKSILKNLPYSVNTFFILNQIPGGQTPAVKQRISPEFVSLFADSGGVLTNFSASKDTTHLVTYLQHMAVATTSSDAPFYFDQYSEGKEYIEVLGLDNPTGKWSGRRVMSGSVKSPEKLVGNSFISYLSGSSFHTIYDWQEFRLSYANGGRSGLGDANSRNFRTPFAGFQNGGEYKLLTLTSSFNERQTINNPYLILPGDKLIFGWHSPIMKNFQAYRNLRTSNSLTSLGNGPRLTLPPGVTKVTFYGSQLRNGEQFHDTLNQNLTSVTINEAIGD